MIKNSFIFLDRVGKTTEEKVWQSGIHHWNDFLNEKFVPGIGLKRKPFYDRQITQASRALHEYDSKHFHGLLANGDMWRLYNHFKDDAVYLDIETTGYHGSITVLGLYDGSQTMMFVRDRNLDKELVKKALENYKVILTFNGSSFDLPVIKKYFGDIVPKIPHIDLRHVCSKVGLVGGLKKIEKQLKIKRADEVADVTGEDAIYLWRQYKATGDEEYLNTLCKYNEEDIVNLEPLAGQVIDQLKHHTMRSFK